MIGTEKSVLPIIQRWEEISERHRALDRQRWRLSCRLTVDDFVLMHLINGIKEGYPLCCVIQFAQDMYIGERMETGLLRHVGSGKKINGVRISAGAHGYVHCWDCADKAVANDPYLSPHRVVA